MNPIQKLFSELKQRETPLIGVVPGSGFVTKLAVNAGADLLFALNAGYYRNQGCSSLDSFLSHGKANQQTVALLSSIAPKAAAVPMVAGVLPTDSEVELKKHLGQLIDLGAKGVTNWPPFDLTDDQFKKLLEADGFGTAKGQFKTLFEADGFGTESSLRLFRAAREHDLACLAFAFTPEDVKAFVNEHVDALILSLGLTTEFKDVFQKTDQVQQSIQRAKELIKHVPSGSDSPQTPCLVTGGAITSPINAEDLFRQVPVCGFVGGSAFERLPVEDLVTSTIRKFKSLSTGIRLQPSEKEFGDLVGKSTPMLELYQLVRRISPHDINICIEGETGTGKELVANQIHHLSNRKNQPFITLNCGAIPDALLESELFGYERGAFTGAYQRRLGKFELAHGGTLFLDEVADLSPRGQVALLRVIQQGEVTRVGGDRPIPIDVRIITATHQSLEELVSLGEFRADLYYRLNHFSLCIPPLRARAGDIELLTGHFLRRLEVRMARRIIGLTQSFRKRLAQHAWPGNVRELEHVLTRSAVMEDASVLEGSWFEPNASAVPLGLNVAGATQNKQTLATNAIEQAGGNKSKAAKALGITRKTLYRWLNENGA